MDSILPTGALAQGVFNDYRPGVEQQCREIRQINRLSSLLRQMLHTFESQELLALWKESVFGITEKSGSSIQEQRPIRSTNECDLYLHYRTSIGKTNRRLLTILIEYSITILLLLTEY